tara:strand:- start:608 stop:868 length:261 start_codon:yes stop_codon:yes gene_type:complete
MVTVAAMSTKIPVTRKSIPLILTAALGNGVLATFSAVRRGPGNCAGFRRYANRARTATSPSRNDEDVNRIEILHDRPRERSPKEEV